MSYNAFKSSLSSRGPAWSKKHNVEIRHPSNPRNTPPGPGSYNLGSSLMHPSHNVLANPAPPAGHNKRGQFQNNKSRKLRSSFPLSENSLSDSITETGSQVSLADGSTGSVRHSAKAKVELEAYLASLKLNQYHKSNPEERKSLKSTLSSMVKAVNDRPRIEKKDTSATPSPPKNHPPAALFSDEDASVMTTSPLLIGGVTWSNIYHAAKDGTQSPNQAVSVSNDSHCDSPSLAVALDANHYLESGAIVKTPNHPTYDNPQIDFATPSIDDELSVGPNEGEELQKHLDFYHHAQFDANFFPKSATPPVHHQTLPPSATSTAVSGSISLTSFIEEVRTLTNVIAAEAVDSAVSRLGSYDIFPARSESSSLLSAVVADEPVPVVGISQE